VKHLATKERRMDRQEFVYLHKDIIFQEKIIVNLAREELGYSCKTADCDIYCSLVKTLKALECLMKN
jgi:hypothetical protein